MTIDITGDTVDQTLILAEEATSEGKPLSIALLGNAADIHHDMKSLKSALFLIWLKIKLQRGIGMTNTF
ncbi:hypothetical protein [Bacillus salipaludis]|uniref:hypothetical protein n=1 Tax=Bacillus salipaludis TaxID=2547811 RepID=UPI003D1C77E7